MIKNLKNKKKGFTLIELIIVIAIIAILAAVAIPKFGEVRRNANIKSDIANAKNIQSAAVALLGENKIAYGVAGGTELQLGAIVDPIDTDSERIVDYLQNLPKTNLIKDGTFVVTISDKGNVKVYISETKETGVDEVTDKNQVYPEPSETKDNSWYQEN